MTEVHIESLIIELLDAHNGLKYATREDGCIVVTGPYALDASYDGVRLVEDFELELTIPSDYPKSLPSVRELSNIIDPSYEHLFVDHKFCLGVQGELLIAQQQNPSLIRFLDGPARSFLYSYLFYSRYGRYPFGDRDHGTKGILQFYSEFFNEPDLLKAWRLLLAACTEEYRGHLPCPCGSGIAGRKCHGNAILGLKRSGALLGAKNDLGQTMIELKEAKRESEERHRMLDGTGIDLSSSDPVDAFFRHLLA